MSIPLPYEIPGTQKPGSLEEAVQGNFDALALAADSVGGLGLLVGSGSATIASGMADTMVTPGFATACVMFWAAVNPVTNADITMYPLIIGRDGYIRTKSPVSQTINFQWAALGH